MPNQDGTGPLVFGPGTGRLGERYTALAGRRRRRRAPCCPGGVIRRRSGKIRRTSVRRLSNSGSAYSK